MRFILPADSLAFFRIHDASVLDADFGYAGGTEVSGSIQLKAGRRAIRLSYVRGTGVSPALSLQWKRPGHCQATYSPGQFFARRNCHRSAARFGSQFVLSSSANFLGDDP